jgi:hypothetical protein
MADIWPKTYIWPTYKHLAERRHSADYRHSADKHLIINYLVEKHFAKKATFQVIFGQQPVDRLVDNSNSKLCRPNVFRAKGFRPKDARPRRIAQHAHKKLPALKRKLRPHVEGENASGNQPLEWSLERVFHSGRLQPCPPNVRLGWKWMTVTNTLP